jgi:gamma-glutamylcyclotransferase
MTADERMTFHYFAYGSNMLSERLKERCPSARALGIAQLPGYTLRWHKRSKDGSGKCDVVAYRDGQVVFGVVYEIDVSERAALDRAEGCGYGYERRDVEVILNGDVVTTSVYIATRNATDSALKPYIWYKCLVVAGAKEHGLPAPYIANLEAVEALEDPNSTRHNNHMRIVSATQHSDEA